jgi:S1-C subfamily serine protease
MRSRGVRKGLINLNSLFGKCHRGMFGVRGFVAVTVSVLLSGSAAVAQDSTAQPGSLLAQFERELQSVVEAVRPSIVTVRATHSTRDMHNPSLKRAPSMSVGSGLILDSTGLIMTASRVVKDADDYWVETTDGRMYQAALLGSSEDISVLQIKGKELSPASFGDAVDLGVGSFVAALGNSYGFACGVSWGQVNGFRPDGTIQLALGVSPGNTGGALVNTRGLVVGLIKAKISEPFYLDPLHLRTQVGPDTVPISFPGRRLELPTSPVSLAIPIQTALRQARRIIESGTEPRAYVGVYVEDLTGWYVAHFKTSDGVLVTGVVDRTPAQESGLQRADVITAVDRQEVNSVRRFRQVVGQALPGQRLQFDVIRGGRPLKLVVEAGQVETPHLSKTDAGLSPYSPQATEAKAENQGSAPRKAATPVTAEKQSPERTVASDPPPPSWLARLEAMQATIDSLKEELSCLQQEVQQPRK